MTEQGQQKRDGVRVPPGASTPSPFPASEVIEPSLPGVVAGRFADSLELAAVLDVVAGLANGPLGAERVRRRLPRTDSAWVRTELGRVGELLAWLDRGGGLDVPPVPEIGPVLKRLAVAGSALSGSELVALRRTATAGRTVRAELARAEPEAPSVASLIAAVPDQRLERRLTESLADDGELLDAASPRLARARRAIHEARERLLRKLESVLRTLDSQAAPAGAQVTVRGDRYVIPVRRDARGRPAGIIHDESTSHGTLFVEPTDAIEFGNALRSAIADADREALAVLRELTDLCRPAAADFREAHDMCVAADDLLARVRYGRSVRATVPAVGSERLRLTAARHPLLLERGVAVVPFDLVLEPHERTVLVSGPNTGGKTVLLKTAGLVVLMAQAGVVPPVGPGTELPLVERVYADIGDHQSIAADLSTFSAHVAVLREILEAADSTTLVLLDEVGSGTDPAEGAALARASLRELTRRGALSFATTHLGALKTLASETAGIVNGSLEFDAVGLRPTFTFRKGVPGRSYGLAIAERLGIPEGVLRQARAEVPDRELALDELLAQLEARARDQEARDHDLRSRLGVLEAREAAVRATADAQDARDQALRQREREAERAARREARRHLLEARERVEEAIRAARSATDPGSARQARRMVEDAVQEGADALHREEDAGREPAAPVAPGQRVRVPSGAAGTVLDVRADGRATVLAGAVRLVVPVAELAPAVGPPAERRAPRGDDPGAPEAPGEVDLRGLTGDEAHAAALAALDAAVLADRSTIRFIHGMGTGVVRERVRRLLQSDRRVRRFEFAPRQQGGTGVTIADLGSGP